MQDAQALLVAQVRDAVQWVIHRGYPKYLGFFNEQEASVVLSCLRGVSGVSYQMWAGYEQGERVMLGIFPAGEEVRTEDFPIEAVCFTYRAQDRLTHRDFLGALMALGIERSTVGDIVVGNGRTTVFLHSNIAGYCLAQISKIGAVGVRAEAADPAALCAAPRFEEKSTTIASARLDNVVCAVCNTSRARAAEWIADGLVAVDGIITTKGTKQLSGSCKLSVRGCGKFVILDAEQQTRRGRLVLQYKKYI